MDGFLAESRRVGEHDSEGRFELAGDRALAKLKEYTVARPEEWILKMVQAAVAGEAGGLEILQNRRTTVLRFALGLVPTVAEVETALLTPEAPATPFLRELAIGLRSLLSSRQLTLRWPAPDGGCLHWNGQSLTPDPEAAGAAVFEICVTNPQAGWLSGHKERATEAQLLRTRAAYCPIPLWLDHREVTVLDLCVNAKQTDHAPQSPTHFASGYLREPQGPGQTAQATRSRNPLRYQAPLVRWERDENPVLGAFSLFATHSVRLGDLDESFRLIWTRHGVACAAREIPKAPLGGFLQIPGDHLRSDLSGLQLHVEEDDVSHAMAKLPLLDPPGRFALSWLRNFQPPSTYGEIAVTTAKYTGMAVVIVVAVAAVVGLAFVSDGAALGAMPSWGGDGKRKTIPPAGPQWQDMEVRLTRLVSYRFSAIAT